MFLVTVVLVCLFDWRDATNNVKEDLVEERMIKRNNCVPRRRQHHRRFCVEVSILLLLLLLLLYALHINIYTHIYISYLKAHAHPLPPPPSSPPCAPLLHAPKEPFFYGCPVDLLMFRTTTRASRLKERNHVRKGTSYFISSPLSFLSPLVVVVRVFRCASSFHGIWTLRFISSRSREFSPFTDELRHGNGARRDLLGY